MTLALLLALDVDAIVFGAIGPLVVTLAVLLPLLPESHILLAFRIIDHTFSAAVVRLEITFVDLATRPQERALAMLLSMREQPIEDSSIWPLEQALAVHDIELEGSLVDLASRCDSATPSMDLALVEVAFEQ